MRVAFAYDRLAPETLGGAERYYRALCSELAARGEHVSYLTRRHWDDAAEERDGVRLVAVDRARPGGVAGKLTYAAGLFAHLLRHGGDYDVVHVCCFPYTSVLAAAAGLAPHRRTRMVVDWHEVLTAQTWRRRLGRVLGGLGYLAQRAALRCGDAAVTFARLHERRLAGEGFRGPVEVMPEFDTGLVVPPWPPSGEREPLIVFAGRLVAEKRPALVPAVVAALRARDPAWRAVLFGSGPEEAAVRAEAARLGVGDAVELAGFAPYEQVAAAMLRGRVLVHPTAREGFGLVVLEAAAHGLPAVLVAGPDNAAVERIEEGGVGVVVDDSRSRRDRRGGARPGRARRRARRHARGVRGRGPPARPRRGRRRTPRAARAARRPGLAAQAREQAAPPRRRDRDVRAPRDRRAGQHGAGHVDREPVGQRRAPGHSRARASRPPRRSGPRRSAWWASEATMWTSPSRACSIAQRRTVSPNLPASDAAVTWPSAPAATSGRSRSGRRWKAGHRSGWARTMATPCARSEERNVSNEPAAWLSGGSSRR